MTKYIFITGGVLSGLGKGLVTCSVGKMLEVRGFKVTAVKCDLYLNVDAGTMNPYIHGEVFVLEDGYEADMDLGTYERFLSGEFSGLNNITSGQVYQEVIRRERKAGTSADASRSYPTSPTRSSAGSGSWRGRARQT